MTETGKISMTSSIALFFLKKRFAHRCKILSRTFDKYLMSLKHSNKALVEDGGFTQNK